MLTYLLMNQTKVSILLYTSPRTLKFQSSLTSRHSIAS